MRVSKSSLVAVCAVPLLAAGCAGKSQPFSVRTPGLTTLQQEEALLYRSPENAMASLARTSRPHLADRVANLITTYEQELVRAEANEGGFANTALSLTSLAIPLVGTVGSALLSDAAAEQIGIISNAASTTAAGFNAFYQPGQRAARGKACSAFLRNSLGALKQRWDPATIASLENTPAQWEVYLAVRSTLDAGRAAVCPEPIAAKSQALAMPRDVELPEAELRMPGRDEGLDAARDAVDSLEQAVEERMPSAERPDELRERMPEP